MKQAVILMFFSLFFISCAEEEKPKGEPEVFWVYSYPVPCDLTGTTETTCLGITYSEEFDFELASLKSIPFEIEGYTFKPYFIQKLQVLKFEDPKTGEIRRKLVQVIEEERDYINLLEGSWRVKRYMGENLPNPNFPVGQGVTIAPVFRMAGSSDGCNGIILQIKKVSPNKIVSVRILSITSMACLPDWIKLVAFPGLNENFKREGNLLIFFDDEEKEVAVWEKIN